MEGHMHIQMHAYTLPSWHEFLNKPPENVCKHTAKHFCTPPLTAWQSVCVGEQAQNPTGNYFLYKSIKASLLSYMSTPVSPLLSFSSFSLLWVRMRFSFFLLIFFFSSHPWSSHFLMLCPLEPFLSGQFDDIALDMVLLLRAIVWSIADLPGGGNHF